VRGNNVDPAGPSLTRQIDLSGFTSGTFSFTWRGADSVYETNDEIYIETSTDGVNFTAPQIQFEGIAIDNATGASSIPLTPTVDGTVYVRIRVNPNTFFGGTENLFIDNVVVTANTTAETCQVLTTDASGNYLFTGQVEGEYSVTVLNPPADSINTDDPGGNGDSTNQLTLRPTGGNLEQDFGYYIPATVIGHIYLDTNGNGIQDLGEPNIPNLDVLITDSLGNLQVVTTNANGDYTASVPPGSTHVDIDENDPEYPTGFIQTDGVDPTIVIAVAGTTSDAGDDGYYQGNAIGDTVYLEVDGTPGTQGPTDPGIANRLVTLTPPVGVDVGAGPGVPITTTTDANGNYNFVGLPDGTYTVTVSGPAGHTQTEDPDGGNDSTSVVTVIGGTTNNDQDFGYENNVPAGQIGDRIFADTNGNGVQDPGEPGIPGIVVQICGDLDDDNSTANTCRTETTDADGDYLFGDGFAADGTTADPADSGLPATDGAEVYTVTVTNPPAGQTNTADPDGGLPNFSQLTLAADGGNLDQDFGYSSLGSVSGHLYIDTNGDGVQGPGEPDLVGVDVIITDSNGVQQTVTSDSNGNYSANVPAGNTVVDVDETDPQYPLNHIQTEGSDPTSVTVIAGSNADAGIDGYAPLGQIGDLIFFDSVTEGTIGVYEPGISTTTDFNGNYSFGSLPAGSYQITVTQPNNTNPTVDPNEAGACTVCDNTSTIVIGPGGSNLDQDFGYESLVPDATIGDRVFEDVNGNGIDDPGEPGIPGIDVQLCGDLDNDDSTPQTCRTETTDANGNYLFGDGFLADGVTPDANDTGVPGTTGTEDYTITILNPPANAENTVDPDGESPDVAQLTLPSGISNLDQDFGYVLNSITGSVSEDTDGDGVGDVALESAIVQLYSDPNGDGNPEDGELIAEVTTDANGEYRFSSLPVGDYVLVEIDPAGLRSVNDGDTTPDEGDDAANGAAPLGNLDNLIPVSLVSGEIDADNNFVDANTASIAGSIWLDEDQDGIADVEESGITGVTVQLVDDNGVVVATTVADANGNYSFENVFPGDYTINVVDGNGTPVAELNNTAGPNGVNPRPVTVQPGDVISDIDFGYVPNANEGAIGDRIWADANNNGIQDPGEAGIEGTPTVGPQSEGGYISNPVTIDATLQVVTDIDFGFDNDNLNTIRDTVWFDVDGDGVRDPDEAGMPNVTVDIINAAGEVVATAVTDENGDVVFTGLPDGTYRLVVTDNNDEIGLSSGTTEEGVARISEPVTVSGAADVNDNSFGYNNPGLISGTVYADDNNDSDQNPGELGVAGSLVTLRLDADNDGTFETVVTTTHTDEAGNYEFDGLPPGAYQVIVSSPGGTQTEDPDTVVDNQTNVTLGIGEGSVDNDFGYTNVPNLFDMTGTVFLDPDKDGIEDVGEVGFEGVTLEISRAYQAIDGRIDLTGDGAVGGADDGVYLGYNIINGRPDINGDGAVNGLDDGVINGVTVINGFFDFDGNGSVANIETGRLADDGTFAAVPIGQTTTDANGDYSFTGLPNGDYTVSVTDQAALLSGYDITSGLDQRNETVNNADVSDVDFGYIKEETTGSIAGEVWVDEDGDGVADEEELNLSNVDVHLCRAPLAAGEVCDPLHPNYVATTTTDANGEYIFTDLPPGQYVIDTDPADLPEGLEETVDPTPASSPINLSEGEDLTDANIGHEPVAGSGVLSGFVWVDVDNDGMHDLGEAPIGGVTVIVRDPSTATEANPQGDILFTTTTNPDGSWVVSNINGANLKDGLLVAYVPADIDLNAGADLNESQPTNLPLGEYNYFPVDLASDPDNNIGSLDFGFNPEPSANLGSISGVIYSDVDQNGDYAAATDGEFQGVTLNLVDSSGNVVATTQTDENGNYSFTGIPDGSYTVVITDLDNVTKDLNPLEVIPTPIVISGGNNVVDQDAGFVSDNELFSIGNRFFFDTNNNGQADDGEPGIPGVTVQCWLDVDASETPNDPSVTSADAQPQRGVDNLIRTAVTDANGEFYCTSLPAGQYIVTVADAGDFDEATDGATVTGNAADNFAKNWTYALTLTDSAPNYAADFGVTGSNSLSGTIVVEDISLTEPNDNGILEPTELDGTPGGNPDEPAANVPVILYVEQNGEFVPLLETVTDGNGFYEFTNLPDGNYRVEVITDGSPIDGFGQTGDPALANQPLPEDRVCDSPTAVVCDSTSPDYNLSGGANESGVNFAYQSNFATTPVTMNFFSAVRNGSVVEFNWETSNEVGHAGFQIYARSAEDWVLLTPELITGLGGQAMQTRSYTFQVATDHNWFALVDVSNQEEVIAHGPFKAGQAYGANMVTPSEFDWSGLKAATPRVEDVRDSVNSRVRQAIRAGEFNDDEFDEPEFDEEAEK